jgi:hypothetical protein
MAELWVKLGKLPIGMDMVESGKELLGDLQQLVDQGVLSYGLLLATKL